MSEPANPTEEELAEAREWRHANFPGISDHHKIDLPAYDVSTEPMDLEVDDDTRISDLRAAMTQTLMDNLIAQSSDQIKQWLKLGRIVAAMEAAWGSYRGQFGMGKFGLTPRQEDVMMRAIIAKIYELAELE